MHRTASTLDSKSVEIIKDRLYWISDHSQPKNDSTSFFHNIDRELTYQAFSSDFGPLDMGKTYRYITELEKILNNSTYANSKIYHFTSMDSAKRANAACLMGAYQVIILGKTAEEAWAPFTKVEPSFVDYKDASYTASPYKCTILDCLRGLEYAMKMKWFDMKLFNLRDYEYYEKVINGDLNWIIPGKFVAFSGPQANKKDADGYLRFTPEDYVPIFKKMGVTMVIRLNDKKYDEEKFIQNGIKHLDLYFPDGSCPSDSIVLEFIKACEQERGAIAVHCKAGLGRTGTLIAAYAMKHFKCFAADFIGYIRLCRPGSILGPQQQFLIDKQNWLHKQSENSSIYKSISYLVHDFHSRRESLSYYSSDRSVRRTTEMSAQDKKIAEYGDHGQAERLLDAKYRAKHHETPVDYQRVIHDGYKFLTTETGTYTRSSPVYSSYSPQSTWNSNTYRY